MPAASAPAGSMTSSSKIALAASIVASCSSSLEPKCANSPLLLIPTAAARRPSDRPPSPSTVARRAVPMITSPDPHTDAALGVDLDVAPGGPDRGGREMSHRALRLGALGRLGRWTAGH